MVHIHHRKKTPGGYILARSGSCRESALGIVGTMNAALSRPDLLATVQSGRKQAQSRVCTPGLMDHGFPCTKLIIMISNFSERYYLFEIR